MKEQLTALIESYAAARASGDGLLQQFAAGQLRQFLAQVEVVAETPEPIAPAEGEEAEAEAA